MIYTYQTLKIFISSPSDVPKERKFVEKVIKDINDKCCDDLGLSLKIINWENMTPSTPNLSKEKIQDIINEKVRECNIFILILNRRYGTIKNGHKKSNTEREVEIALNRLLKDRKITFLSYFKRFHIGSHIGVQAKKVLEFRQRLEDQDVWFNVYKDLDEFKNKVTHDIYNTIIKFKVSSRKQKYLKKFWQFGIAEGDHDPKLAIIYPPVCRRLMRQENPDHIWFKRLMPNVVFEDLMAINKVQKTLRLVGFNYFKTYCIADIPNDIHRQNRVWICLPRSSAGQDVLMGYKDRSHFYFDISPRANERTLHWRKSLESNNYFKIKSPLKKYLSLQRKNKPGGDWSYEHSRIVAKDYAILARFNNDKRVHIERSPKLKDYFIAGIRGLGTWGAAWAVDRIYTDLFAKEIDEDDEFQILLEIIYVNGRIKEAKDVSCKDEAYFKKEYNLKTIKKRINKYKKFF